MENPCETCGACCEGCSHYGVDPVDVAHVPAEFYGRNLGPSHGAVGMWTVPRPDGRSDLGRRCVALQGTVGSDARCTLYPTGDEPDRRPWVCAAVPPGSWLCALARHRATLPALDATPWPPPGWAMRLGWPPAQFQRFGIVFHCDADVWRAWMDHLRESLDERWPFLQTLYPTEP